jgi:NitT/TauT family transport system permease protein
MAGDAVAVRAKAPPAEPRGAGWGRLTGYRLALAAAFLGLWEFATDRWIDPFWFSSPLRITRHLVEMAGQMDTYRDLWVTMSETFLGYFAGAILGVVVGLALSRLETLAKVLDPFLVAINGIPRVALAPLFIIWFGIDIKSKIVLASTLVFFITFYNTFAGVRGVDQAFQNVARVMGAGEGLIFLKVILPAASPWIITGLKMSLPFALIGAIIGEFMAASKGLGFRLQLYTGLFNTTGAIAVIFILMLMMIALNALLNWAEEHLLRWRPKTPIGGEATEVH